jgi:hypothetical protein
MRVAPGAASFLTFVPVVLVGANPHWSHGDPAVGCPQRGRCGSKSNPYQLLCVLRALRV